jgi:hypothetical protein
MLTRMSCLGLIWVIWVTKSWDVEGIGLSQVGSTKSPKLNLIDENNIFIECIHHLGESLKLLSDYGRKRRQPGTPGVSVLHNNVT